MSKQILVWFLEQHLGEQAAQKGEEQRPLLCAQDQGNKFHWALMDLFSIAL